MLVEEEQLHLEKLKMLCFKDVSVVFLMCVFCMLLVSFSWGADTQ